MKLQDFGTHAELAMRGSTLSLGPTNFDSQNAVDLRKYRNLGFSELLT